MDKITNSPLEFRKKISLNINTSILSLVKELAKLTKTNNTLVIESLLTSGIYPLTKQFRDTWLTMSCTTKDKEKKDRLNKLLEELKKICEKQEYAGFFNIGSIINRS